MSSHTYEGLKSSTTLVKTISVKHPRASVRSFRQSNFWPELNQIIMPLHASGYSSIKSVNHAENTEKRQSGGHPMYRSQLSYVDEKSMVRIIFLCAAFVGCHLP
jgi:hypothetical protein